MTKVTLKHQVIKYNGWWIGECVKHSVENSTLIKPMQLQQSSHIIEGDKESNSKFATTWPITGRHL